MWFISRIYIDTEPANKCGSSVVANKCGSSVAKPEAISCGMVEIPLRLLHFVRNDDKAGIAEAKAEPVAARPERATAD